MGASGGRDKVAVADFIVNHTGRWIDHFASHGYDVRPLAAGVEGAIYDLGAGLVAKVWRSRPAAELERMQRFYADVAATGLPFATPEIIRVDQVDGTAVSYERKLSGEPMQNRLRLDDQSIAEQIVASVIDVLRALATVTGTSSMRQLAVLDERQPLWADAVLVDDQGRPIAVLDFGFLTTAGDPRLDAAITASIMNMYGPHALAITRSLTTRFAHDLGYRADVILIYQAAYAVATSNAFTPDGSDGHFAWCVTQLRRPEVREALGI